MAACKANLHLAAIINRLIVHYAESSIFVLVLPWWLLLVVGQLASRVGLGEGEKEVRHQDTCFMHLEIFLEYTEALHCNKK